MASRTAPATETGTMPFLQIGQGTLVSMSGSGSPMRYRFCSPEAVGGGRLLDLLGGVEEFDPMLLFFHAEAEKAA